MKGIILLLILAALSFSCSRQASKSFIPADNKSLSYTGRFDFSNNSKPVFMYSGCSIRTLFDGTSVEMVMKDDSLRNIFTVIIDDSLFNITTSKRDNMYLLADHLQNKKHTLEIFRRTEWHAGNTTFCGLYLDKGMNVYTPEIRERKIEFIGDSYTCGYGNEGKSCEEHFKYTTENNYMTFGAITARELNSDYLTVCRSGIGIWQGYGGDKNFTMPKLYDEVTANNKRTWDYSKFNPQLVVIDLAGNDLSAPLDSSMFVNTYLDFLKRIRKNYSSAKIVCVAGPSTPDTTWLKWQNYIHAVVDQSSKNDRDIHYFEFTPFTPNGSDWHPNVEEHRKMAQELTPFIKNLMNW